VRAALRNEPEAWLEFYSREQLIDALRDAGEAAFGVPS
jgi:predicted RNA polymerase sigma factor